MIAQVIAREGDVAFDKVAAFAALEDTAFTAPLNTAIRAEALDWMRASPDGGVTTVGDIRISYSVRANQLVLGFTYPPALT